MAMSVETVMQKILDAGVDDTPTLQRFVSKIHILDEHWLWMGGRSRGGYGKFWLIDKKNNVTAHRWLYELVFGAIDPWPVGQLDHVCGMPPCVNVFGHIEVVSCRENLLRSENTLASRNRSATRCPQGHLYDDENTYRMPNGGRACRKCRLEAHRRWKARSA